MKHFVSNGLETKYSHGTSLKKKKNGEKKWESNAKEKRAKIKKLDATGGVAIKQHVERISFFRVRMTERKERSVEMLTKLMN